MKSTHLHYIVPAAGYSLSGKWRHIGKYDNYLYPVHQLSAAFKGKFMDSIKRELGKLSASPTLSRWQLTKTMKRPQSAY